MHLHGRGVPRNPEEAMRWTRIAAEHGSAEAMADMGESFLNTPEADRDADAVIH